MHTHHLITQNLYRTKNCTDACPSCLFSTQTLARVVSSSIFKVLKREIQICIINCLLLAVAMTLVCSERLEKLGAKNCSCNGRIRYPHAHQVNVIPVHNAKTDFSVPLMTIWQSS